MENLLTGFYMRATLALNGLNKKQLIRTPWHNLMLDATPSLLFKKSVLKRYYIFDWNGKMIFFGYGFLQK